MSRQRKDHLQRRRGAAKGLLLTAEQFNQLVPVGTAVWYYPIAGGPGFIATRTRSVAWETGHGDPIVKVYGISGGVSLSHIELVAVAS